MKGLSCFVCAAIRKFLCGPPARPKAERPLRLRRALPVGNNRPARILRAVLLAQDDLKYVLPRIRPRPFQVAFLVVVGPSLVLNELMIAVLIGSGTRRSVVSAPASNILALIKFLVPTKAFERIFAQAVEDFREEYYLELAGGGVWRARWLHVCLYVTLLSTAALWLGTSVAKKAVDLWKIS